MSDFGLVVETDGDGGWSVSLPHQCDRWAIAGDINYRQYVSHDEALQELRNFGNEIAAAIITLAQRRTFGESTKIGREPTWLA